MVANLRFCTLRAKSSPHSKGYITKFVRHSRPFLNRMLDLLRGHFGKDNIQLDIHFRRTLIGSKHFLPQFNGKPFFVHRPVQATIELDACL